MKLQKGALVSFMPALGLSMPNVVAFQFNPETLRHSWTQPPPGTPGSNPLAAQGLPGETFSFTLAMDMTDQFMLEAGDSPGAGLLNSGIYSRLAALEMLMFPLPSGSGLPGDIAGTGAPRAVPAEQLRTVLFVWGALRIVPVRLSSLTITEKLFDAALNPTHAEAQIELRVLTPDELKSLTGPFREIAKGAYEFSQRKREALAILNLGNAAQSISLPIPQI